MEMITHKDFRSNDRKAVTASYMELNNKKKTTNDDYSINSEGFFLFLFLRFEFELQLCIVE